MTTQPEALLLADEIEPDYCRCLDAYKDRGRVDPQCESCNTEDWRKRAAAELRRLQALNAELLEALKTCVCAMQDYQAGIGITQMFDAGERMGRAAIAKAEGRA